MDSKLPGGMVKYQSLDVLRGVAAIWVFLSHLSIGFPIQGLSSAVQSVLQRGYLGVGGFGNLINSGLQLTVGRAQVVTASLCCVLLAVVADLGLLGLQRLLTPWAGRRGGVAV